MKMNIRKKNLMDYFIGANGGWREIFSVDIPAAKSLMEDGLIETDGLRYRVRQPAEKEGSDVLL